VVVETTHGKKPAHVDQKAMVVCLKMGYPQNSVVYLNFSLLKWFIKMVKMVNMVIWAPPQTYPYGQVIHLRSRRLSMATYGGGALVFMDQQLLHVPLGGHQGDLHLHLTQSWIVQICP
jgi:hypothetical protein